eukprot:CAMPEP_0180244892 /NCGR_PEP_ID=MMETSP0987-20121128/34684_1 /TAXON_ID=697907 /ORGANISM="non described non described, Strain CCMP2293" /LENGTH=98 /DNA_ID=CAMNT_0022212473 /DNA_START=78 /DNA_END=371 /DNA_ORIENTATION=-
MAVENASTAVLVGIDVGSDSLVTATTCLASSSIPTLVRNNLSNDATPTALTFKHGGERELGEGAIGAPASNAANFFSGDFLPKLGDAAARVVVPDVRG